MTRTIAFKISVKTLIKYWHGNDDCNREVDTYYVLFLRKRKKENITNYRVLINEISIAISY
jgi:hypothetical protein